ncbi:MULTISPECIES: LacI family DNA-binding transcriptional regulator [Proteiniphilum]|jgi:LacI family transcriptional regulator|uniref:LacI family DNA-binding transcriptional regulator n=1 Tax=Proteiniphilum TaxID=294702 RepID=UPI001EEC4B3F|nr:MULTISPECIES: LacI family DNA-binding transcriptional regulator [Proteiniphilum]ULB35230.1 LacI family DNA-binding transcriptional regulator [Proteiniphilum propionicum]
MRKKIRIKDIAEMAGVSAGTVDRVLHNRGNVSEPARLAVEKVLEKVNYKPNIHVSALSLKRRYKIVVATPEASHGEYWESIHNGIRHAIEEYENIKMESLILTYNQYDIYSCKKVFKEISEMDMDALIVGPTFNEETATLCKKMDAKEIPYVFVDSTIDNTSPIAFFTSDHYMIGCLMAKLITSIIPNNTNIGILQAVRTGDKSANSTIQRKKGFTDFLAKNNCFHNILNIPFSVSEPEKNEIYLARFFSKHDNVPGIVVMNSRGSIVSDYLLRNNINRVKMICMDLTSPNIEALKKGQIDFLIGQEPEYQGFCAMKTLLEYLTFKKPVNKENYVQLDILTKETIDYYKKFNNIVY